MICKPIYDLEDFIMLSFLGAVLIFIIMLGGAIILISFDSAYINPVASDNANLICIERGFDYAENFDRIFLSDKPLNVKCGIVEKFKVDIDGGLPVKGVK